MPGTGPAHTPEGARALIDACHLITAALCNPAVYVDMRDERAVQRVITKLARIAGTLAIACGQNSGLDYEQARVMALAWLREQIDQCDLLLLDTGEIHGPEASVVRELVPVIRREVPRPELAHWHRRQMQQYPDLLRVARVVSRHAGRAGTEHVASGLGTARCGNRASARTGRRVIRQQHGCDVALDAGGPPDRPQLAAGTGQRCGIGEFVRPEMPERGNIPDVIHYGRGSAVHGARDAQVSSASLRERQPGRG